jgi:hypothetical protein
LLTAEAHDPLLAMLGIAIKAEQPKREEREADRNRS